MMPRWVVFDPETALELRSRMPHAAVFEAPGRRIVEYALDRSKGAVLVLPAPPGNSAVIAVFHPEPAPATQPDQGSRTRPGGILGLSEEFVSDEEGPPPKKNWWRRFWSD
jgi:hypothetical protein